MSNMHRLIWFDRQLRALLYPNRNTLAEKFEISVRQAHRDIDYLKNSLDAPIVYDAKRRGYYYEDSSYTLPNVFINDIQKRMLKFLAYRYENYTQTPKVAQMSELFKKLAEDDEIDDEVPIFDLGKPVVQSYYNIYNAICSKNKLLLLYRDAYEGNIKIRLDPVKLFFKYQTDYLAGYDNDKQKIVVLRLDRILELDVLPECFMLPREYDERKFSGFIEKEPYIARVQFNEGRPPKEERGIRIRQVEGSVYEIEFFDIDEFINILLCSGNWDRVLSPKWLRQKIETRCEEIIRRLKE